MTASPASGPGGLAALAEQAGLARIAMIAWRDLGDPEAGGSELHAHEIARRWAAAGIEVTVRTSSVAGEPERLVRNGYTVVRRSGRYQVFGTAPADILRGRLGTLDGLVEIWNGMPFFSPVWAPFAPRMPRVTFLHHVHAEMWRMVLPPRLAAIGETIEAKLAPRIYRRSRLVTLSESSRAEIVDLLGMRRERVSVVPPGIDNRYSAAGAKSVTPLIVAVGRLVPVKRFDRLVRSVAELHDRRGDVECLIIGEGVERERLESLRHQLGADTYVHLPGRLGDGELVDAYRRAWVLAATSVREGWGMTISEAAACGTPAVVSRIAGHSDVVIEGHTGLLASSGPEMTGQLLAVIEDDGLRQRLSKAALDRAADLSWEATAEGTLGALASEATRVRSGWRRPRR
ncbi:MAG: glycosyltransferase family 4 protein [Acidimicrobiales bacterium]